MRTHLRCLILICLFLPHVPIWAADEVIEATTKSGDVVILHPNGYWEYVDSKKAAAAKVKVEEIARSEGCPKGTRPSFFGIGRCISIGDDSLKRGSLSGKGW